MTVGPVYQDFATDDADVILPIIGLAETTIGEGVKEVIDIRTFYASDRSKQFEVSQVLNAVNYLRVQGSLASHSLSLSAQGTDTNVTIAYASKGTGGHAFGNGAGTILHLADEGTGEAIQDFFTIQAGSSGQFPRLSSTTGAEYETAQDQRHFFFVGGETALRVAGAAGGGGTKFIEIANGGTYATFFARTDLGTDAAPFLFDAQSSGEYLFNNDSGTVLRLNTGGVATSRPNYVQIENGATNNPPVVRARGSDTNVDLYLQTQGTGVVRFGTHSAIGGETVTGFITVKDASGATRKLAVVS